MNRSRRAWQTLLLIGCAVIAVRARAEEPAGSSVAVTNSLSAEYWELPRGGDADDEFGVILNRLNLIGASNGLTAGLRLDTFAFVGPPPGARSDAILERLSVQVRHAAWVVSAGDFYLELGRGIALSIRKADENGVDLAIRGGRLALNTSQQSSSLFAGLINTANMDSVSREYVDEPGDVVGGLTHEFRGISWMNLGAHGVYLRPRLQQIPGAPNDHWSATGGLSAELPNLRDWLSIYLEGDFQHRVVNGQGTDALSGYLTADFRVRDTTFLWETLYLDDFQQQGARSEAAGGPFLYNRPPTLERIEDEVVTTKDVLGTRLRVDQFFPGWGLLVYGNLTYRFNGISRGPRVYEIHGYGGFEQEFGDAGTHLHGSGGFRDDESNGDTVKAIGHLELDYLQRLTPRFSFHLASASEFREILGERTSRGNSALGVQLADRGELTFDLGFDTENGARGAREIFTAGILGVDISEKFLCKLTAGTQRGGLKCINGICRVYPEFAGVKLDLIARF